MVRNLYRHRGSQAERGNLTCEGTVLAADYRQYSRVRECGGATGAPEFFNRPEQEYFGKTNEELKDWGRIGVIHPEDLPSVIEAWATSIKTGQNLDIEARFLRADGVYRWFQMRAIPARDAEGKIRDWYALHTDIDDRKRAEQRLRESEAYLAEAQRLSQTGSWAWNPA